MKLSNMQTQLFSFLFLLSKLELSLQKEAFIQYVYTEVVGRTDTPVATRTLNGIPVPWNYFGPDIQRDSVVNTVHGPFFETSLKIILESFNHTTASNHTYQRIRTCKLDGYRVEWVSDLVRYDGADYLRLSERTGVWTAAVPQAEALRRLWASESVPTQHQRLRLEKACTELLQQLARAKHSTPGGPERQPAMFVWVSALAVLSMMGLLLISFLLFKRQVSNGNGNPGGTVGSIIHYPPNASQVTHGYQPI
ncbi:hypothetical protein COCON_G00190260 [Conger conger]|uniref:MHC class I-like antigen recognition-like domain-containing protein n=1 Tax=Conger conger TaxID=82655 RepID=A0A9Q1D415_CONCO|nr:uncharacterized protein LOC133107641 [Conger conger]KAJ8256874.1 hypothetical protein COCON_G00190260 [Conger conger]